MSIAETHALTAARSRAARVGFTMVELLVVIAIIAVLMALLLPALTGARRAGKKSATQSMLTAFTNAASSFSNDHGSRMPGYFSPSQMGDSANLGRRMSAMENVMLDLGGSDVVLGLDGDTGVPNADPEAGIFALSPYEPDNDHPAVIVNAKLIGSGGAYFAPDSKFLAELDGKGAVSSDPVMPDVVDSFGNPLLVWVKDTSARGSIDPDHNALDGNQQFAQTTSDAGGGADGTGGPAWFYLASNECFFGEDSISVGEGGVNQATLSGLSPLMPMGGAPVPVPAEDRIATLAAVLASPSYYAIPSDDTLDTVAPDAIYPSKPRGNLIVQSAGIDGLFYGTNGPGWKSNAVTESGKFRLEFGRNYKSDATHRFMDEDGKFINYDIASDFDDLTNSIN